ncbi:MAG: rRNA adenine N-6-methyltransferase family protein [Chitinophagales bacterium]
MSGFVTALKSYGQHFLTDKIVLDKIVHVIKELRQDEKIIEIGPGTGALTNVLRLNLRHSPVIEVDKRCNIFYNKIYNLNFLTSQL